MVDSILEEVGIHVGASKWLLVVPLVYLPIATDLTTGYVHVQLVLPRRVRSADVPLDFSDSRRLGGMYPLGRDVKSVHDDRQVLAEYDVVCFQRDGRAKRPFVPYDTIEVALEISRDGAAPA